MSAPFVCIYASQVAMCIGANRHKKISEALELMWQRCDPAGYRAALRRNDAKTEEDIAQAVIRASTEVRDLVDLSLRAPCESSDQVARNYEDVTHQLAAVPLGEEERRVVDDLLKRNLYTSYGNLHETSALDYVRQHLGIDCREDPTFYKTQVGVCAGPWGSLPWHVGGKIDAIDAERTMVIEVKNRVNRLFRRVPFYEQVQVQAYMHLLNLDKAVLVECLKINDDKDDPTNVNNTDPPANPNDPAVNAAATHVNVLVNVIPIRRDHDLWQRDIVPKLRGFVDFLARVLHDPDLQDRYLVSKRRSAMITSHINNHAKFNSIV